MCHPKSSQPNIMNPNLIWDADERRPLHRPQGQVETLILAFYQR